MARPNLRVIAGRPVPVLREEYHPLGTHKTWLRATAEWLFLGLAVITLVWGFAVLMLSLGRPV